MVGLYILHIVVPVAIAGIVACVRLPHRAIWLAVVLAFGAFVAHVWVVGRWDIVGFGFRPLLPLLLVGAAVVSFWRVRRPSWWYEGMATLAGVAGCLLLGGVFLSTTVTGLAGQRAPANAVDLLFPVPEGTAYIGHGGSTSLINYHRSLDLEPYAVDIFMLNEEGVRARGLRPAHNEAYAIWNARVVSPCDGFVSGAFDRAQDNPPGERNLALPKGNYVAVTCDEITVVLAHLRQGSVKVRLGDPVRSGETIGRVGNSGNSPEPHLHVHAEDTTAHPAAGRSVPMTFGGRYLVRNSLVR